jgi:hypothetical protein
MQHDALGDAVFHDGVLCAGGTLDPPARSRRRGRPGLLPQPGVGQLDQRWSQRGARVGDGRQRRAALLRRLVPQRLDDLLPAGDGQRDQTAGDRRW